MAAEIKDTLEGKWTHVRSEHFDKFLVAMGFGMIKRKLAVTLTPVLTLSVDGETISVNISAGPKTHKVAFKLGEAYDVESPELTGKGMASWSKGQLTTKITPKDPAKGKEQTIVREVIDGELIQTMYVGDVICKRYFKKS